MQRATKLRPAHTLLVVSTAILAGVLLLAPRNAPCGAELSCEQVHVKSIQRICGVVIDPSGTPVPNAKVTILHGGEQVATSRSGRDGTFRVDGLTTGGYEVRIQAEGFYHFEFPITVVKPSEQPKRVLEVELAVPGYCPGLRLVKPGAAKRRCQVRR